MPKQRCFPAIVQRQISAVQNFHRSGSGSEDITQSSRFMKLACVHVAHLTSISYSQETVKNMLPHRALYRPGFIRQLPTCTRSLLLKSASYHRHITLQQYTAPKQFALYVAILLSRYLLLSMQFSSYRNFMGTTLMSPPVKFMHQSSSPAQSCDCTWPNLSPSLSPQN